MSPQWSVHWLTRTVHSSLLSQCCTSLAWPAGRRALPSAVTSPGPASAEELTTSGAARDGTALSSRRRAIHTRAHGHRSQMRLVAALRFSPPAQRNAAVARIRAAGTERRRRLSGNRPAPDARRRRSQSKPFSPRRRASEARPVPEGRRVGKERKASRNLVAADCEGYTSAGSRGTRQIRC